MPPCILLIRKGFWGWHLMEHIPGRASRYLTVTRTKDFCTLRWTIRFILDSWEKIDIFRTAQEYRLIFILCETFHPEPPPTSISFISYSWVRYNFVLWIDRLWLTLYCQYIVFIIYRLSLHGLHVFQLLLSISIPFLSYLLCSCPMFIHSFIRPTAPAFLFGIISDARSSMPSTVVSSLFGSFLK